MKKITIFLFALILCGLRVLAQNGTPDLSFDPGLGFNGSVFAIEIQNDGKILVGGDFTEYNGNSSRPYLLRLNANGTLDNTFNANVNSAVLAIETDNNDIYIGGVFSTVGGVSRNCLAKLTSSGTLVTAFTSQIENGGVVNSIKNLSSGAIFVAGLFDYAPNSIIKNSLIVTKQNGNAQILVGHPGFNDVIINTAVDFDGNANGDTLIVCTGLFTEMYGSVASGIGRMKFRAANNLPVNDSPNFNSGVGFNLIARASAILSDNKMVVTGLFDSYKGINSPKIAKINNDGTIDNSFTSPFSTGLYSGNAIEVDAEGYIVVGGSFMDGGNQANLYRLNPSGQIDAAFNPAGTGPNDLVNIMAWQADGKLLVGGSFTQYNGISYNGIVRLNYTTTVSVPESENELVMNVFPNPASSELNIQLPDYCTQAVVKLIDLAGRVVILKEVTDTNLSSLDIAELQSGIYLLNVTAGGQYVTQKIVKN